VIPSDIEMSVSIAMRIRIYARHIFSKWRVQFHEKVLGFLTSLAEHSQIVDDGGVVRFAYPAFEADARARRPFER
jgi:hypothetical protein